VGLVHDLRADHRQLALAHVGEPLHEQVPDAEAEHRIAEELEPLVVTAAGSDVLVQE
jgi:hypothetical protein